MIAKFVDAFFGCWHSRYSFPITIRPGSRYNGRPAAAASLTGMYVVCLDCGKEIPYDWQQMKVIGTPSQARHYARELASRQAA
jgi:hypothetical protein